MFEKIITLVDLKHLYIDIDTYEIGFEISYRPGFKSLRIRLLVLLIGIG